MILLNHLFCDLFHAILGHEKSPFMTKFINRSLYFGFLESSLLFEVLLGYVIHAAKMKFIVVTSTAFVAFVAAFSLGATQNISEDCQKLSDFVTKALRILQERLPDYFAKATSLEVQQFLNMDITDKRARETFLCKFADAGNLRELYNGIPRVWLSPSARYEDFVQGYSNVQYEVQSLVGGYTNVERVQGMMFDLSDLNRKLGDGDTLQERTDLATLTNFMKVMQIKYGSRWIAYTIHLEHQDFVIEDPEEFAKTLYENTFVEDFQNFTRLEEPLLKQFSMSKDYLDHLAILMKLADLYAEGINLVGDLGFFNLEK